MNRVSRWLLVNVAMAVLFTACGANGGVNIGNVPPSVNPQNEPKFQVISVPLTKILPNKTMSTKYPGLYFEDLGAKIQASRFNFYLLNGLANQTHPSIPKVWSLNKTPIANIPHPDTYTIDYQNGSARLMYGEYNFREDHGIIWTANNLKYTGSTIEPTWLSATIEENDDEGVASTGFYALGDHTVAGCDLPEGKNELMFIKFISPESYPISPREYSDGFIDSCATSNEDRISTITTPLNQNEVKANNYVAVGTMKGEFCIYGTTGAINTGWRRLTEIAKNSGYKADKIVAAVKFINLDKNHYIYWVLEDGNIWRGIIDAMNVNQATFVNLQNPMYKNAPQSKLLNPRSLFVDLKNNVYIASNGDITHNIPAKIYILPAGSFTWQEIVLENDFYEVRSIRLAIDGVTPIIGTATLNYDQDKAYYVSYAK
jgi:hypothetical protein